MASTTKAKKPKTMTREEMWDKFEDCAERFLPRERLQPVFDMLNALETVGNINELTSLLLPAGQ